MRFHDMSVEKKVDVIWKAYELRQQVERNRSEKLRKKWPSSGQSQKSDGAGPSSGQA